MLAIMEAKGLKGKGKGSSAAPLDTSLAFASEGGPSVAMVCQEVEEVVSFASQGEEGVEDCKREARHVSKGATVADHQRRPEGQDSSMVWHMEVWPHAAAPRLFGPPPFVIMSSLPQPPPSPTVHLSLSPLLSPAFSPPPSRFTCSHAFLQPPPRASLSSAHPSCPCFISRFCSPASPSFHSSS